MSNMNGGVMKSQRARVGAGYQPPALPFTQLPNPDSVLGRVYIASDVGPAPGIELIAAPGRWRPRGGRQVLAMRADNPITTQIAGGVYAETVGPFPGGLVQSGMILQAFVRYDYSGITTSARTYRLLVGNSNPPSGLETIINDSSLTTSGLGLMRNESVMLNITNNTTGPHLAVVGTPVTNISELSLACDFSQQWYAAVWMRSAAENTIAVASATWAAGVVTLTTSAAHGYATGDRIQMSSITPSGYNTTQNIAVTSPTTFTYPLAADPGAYVSGGTTSRVSNMVSKSHLLELVG